jgi:branched-chain amino acid aminotransferase
LVIEWANEAGFVVVERNVDPKELWDADEVFITSSTRDIHPVAELAKLDSAGNVVDRRTIVPGLVTEKLGNIFVTQRAEKLNP